ncbi:unnamed protein product [Onchocerca ochengi]|uniref:C2 domain-containing protein n=1 Tax=Onchocerca ochengi TaxID=42157 RepID=A0A182E8G8_ONCOC|nr:unnamed protein product [Onchocerca ochengi]
MDFQLMEKAMYGDVENDEELMAELLALEAEERAAGHMPANCASKTLESSTVQHTLDCHESTAQASQRMSNSYGISSISDVSDEDLGSDNEENVNDPELLAELCDLVGQESGASCEVGSSISSKPPVSSKFSYESAVDMRLLRKLQELKEEYTSALEAAKERSDALRIKSKIEDLIGKVQAGKVIDENDIPVSIRAIRSVELHAKKADTSIISEPEVCTLPAEVKQVAAEEVNELSKTYQKTVKNLLKGEQLRAELINRRESYIKNAKTASALGGKKDAYEYYVVAKQFDEAIKAMDDGQVTECEENELPPLATPYKPTKHEEVPPPPKTLLDGLQQRMQKYKTLCDQNQMENDNRKYRMNARILKQYEDAIKAYHSNKPVDTSQLPCPFGYPPLPPSGNMAATNTNGIVVSHRRPLPEMGPFAAPEPSISGRQSRQKQQLDFLLKRQLQFKQAAIAAKKKGDMITAKKFLLAAKGFDKMIAASKSGLPVNIEKTPVPPQVRASAKTLKPSLEHHTSFDAAIKGTPVEVFATMEKDLIYQVKLCEEYGFAFTQLGDVTRVKMFETWSAISKRDLILLRELAKRGAAVPQFRYETRNIPSVEVCMEVDENHIELTIIKVVDAKLPAGWKSSDGYLFVKYNFAFPHDAHQTGRTKVISATNSPEYNQKFLLTINRKTKQLQRIIKRNCLKFEIYQKGGFLRSDKLIATADCKLIDLEEKVHIHESIDLMEGRKQTGGKLNYRVRIREPLNGKKLSITQKKWLILEL